MRRVVKPGERIRISRVIARLNVGGPALHVSALSARLPADQFETELLVGGLAAGEIEMSEAIERERVTPVRVRGLGRAPKPHDDILALADLIRRFRRFRPHIVHTHTAKAGALGRIAAKICNVPVVVHTFHGHVFDGYFSPAVTHGVILAERALAQITTKIVTISPRQAADLSERFRIAPRDRFRIVPLGFDFARFDSCITLKGELRRELGVGTDPLVAIVGRLTAIKDHALLFRAVAKSQHPKLRLLVVGGGELEAELRALAAEIQIATRVHFLGFRSDIERILADADVLALTSRNEGTPVAVIEALVAGCMPVVVDVGGVEDVLEHGRFGRLVRTRTPEAFAQALDDALAHPDSGEKRAEARSKTREKYSLDRLISDHVELYSALLRGPGT